ncbi:MAG: hypothetical protein QMD85_04505, partial [Candidatus Aenigmarchaeota archaeon]|nr:hypothetical protein [Candidatus Aenigmarchaeota archaeon]MDI6722832.1 hypothetical protein [Candidatus Aenigmarchaeota archaeon]
MKKLTIQQIEDFYINLGYRGLGLRKILENDSEYQKLLAEKMQRTANHLRLSKKERKKYVLSTDYDYEILAKCHKL